MAIINDNQHWSELYRKALFEEDRSKLPSLLEEADRAVQQRLRELWYSRAPAGNVLDKERRELDAAAYYLGLLRSLQVRKAYAGLYADCAASLQPGATNGSL